MGALHNFKGTAGIQKGATWARRLTWLNADDTPKDLTGYAVKFIIKSTKEAQIPLLYVEGTGVSVVDASGQIDVVIPSTDTDKLSFGTFFYMVVLDGGPTSTIRLLEGQIEVS